MLYSRGQNGSKYLRGRYVELNESSVEVGENQSENGRQCVGTETKYIVRVGTGVISVPVYVSTVTKCPRMMCERRMQPCDG